MAQGSLDAMVRAHAALRGVAVAPMRIASDMRWPASGDVDAETFGRVCDPRTMVGHGLGRA